MHMDLEDFLKNIPSIPKIKADTSNLVGLITDREVEDTIGQLRKNKSLGSDGLTTEFYKHFCEEITPILTLTFNKIFEQKKLAPSQRLAIIILLFKKGDARYLTNYKPISLTNADYKILAYILTSRLDTHLFDIIVVNQTAYMKGHFIGCNIRNVQDAMDHFAKNNLPHLLLFLDFKKAFNSVSHQILFELLHHIGIPDEFITWI